MADIVIVVNSAGLQERRAQELALRTQHHRVSDIVVAPSPDRLRRALRSADVVYVIDAGRAGASAFAAARAMRRACIVELGDPQAPLYRAQGRSSAAVLAGFAIDRAVGLLASGVVVRGRALARELPIRGPWTFLPDGVDLHRFAPISGEPVRAGLGIPSDHLVAGVVGSVTWSRSRRWCYGMELVEALGHLDRTDIHALIVGDGTGIDHLRARAQELGVAERVHLIGRVAHDEVPLHLGALDVCVSTQTDDAIGWSRTTAKLPEYLACNRFVLATNVGEAARLLPPEMLVAYAGSFDPVYPARLAQRLAELVPDVRRIRAQAGTRRLAEAHFDYDRLAAVWDAFVDRVHPPEGAGSRPRHRRGLR